MVQNELTASPIESAASQAVLQKPQQVRAEREPAHSLAESTPASGQTMDPDLNTTTLLKIVSEKTVYSPEMLALEIDLEAIWGSIPLSG